MLYIAALVVVEILLFFLNFKPGTFLVGWDNIMPEFNLGLNLERALSSVWQDYRGLGLVDGMAHSANLLHTLYISILSLAVPQSAVRYVFIFLTHLIGGIALYYLAFHYTKKKPVSFLAAFFYLCNLGIVQMYFAPLEVFAIHFAALPLLTLGIVKYLEAPSKKRMGGLFLLFIATTVQSFVPTVFLAWCIVFGWLIVYYLLSKKKVKEVILVVALFFIANSFWLLPYVYSLKYTTKIIPNTKINQFSSEEIYYRNKSFGGLLDVVQMKGFMLDTVEQDVIENKTLFFMEPWRQHTSGIIYKLIYGSFLGILLLGIISIVLKRQFEYLPYLGALGISFIFLANNTIVVQEINTLLRTLFPLLGEAFRFPFTKFITVFAFSFSVILAVGLMRLFELFEKRQKVIFVLLLSFLVCLVLPAFRGNFISPLLKRKIPDDYLKAISYLNQIPADERIALLPAHTYWNWEVRSWGHIGSGFLWYGSPQPILTRSFDPWSLDNEQFYNELSYAINLNDPLLFKNVLEKYDVKRLLLDQTVINATSSKPINYEKIITFLQTVPSLKKDAEYGELLMYRYDGDTFGMYTLPSSVPTTLSPSTKFTKKDVIYEENGEYITTTNRADVMYPFYPLFTEKTQGDLEFSAEKKDQHVIISFPSDNTLQESNYDLYIPNILAREYLIPVRVTAEGQSIKIDVLYPIFHIDGKTIEIQPATIVYELQGLTDPESIILPDQNLTIGSHDTVYLRNDFINTMILKKGSIQETITIELLSENQPPYYVHSYYGRISQLQAEIPIINNSFSSENIISNNLFEIKTPAEDLNQFKNKESFITSESGRGGHTIEVKNYSSEVSVWIPTLPHESSYIIFLKTDYSSGLPITFSIDNPFEKRAELETRLPKKKASSTIVLPRTQNYYEGYGFHFIVKSLGKETARSTIEDMSIYPFPLETLEGVKLIEKESAQFNGKKDAVIYDRLASFLYTAELTSSNEILVLSQAYNPDWKAYLVDKTDFFTTYFPFFFGRELQSHVNINNWANGWEIDESVCQELSTCRIIIVFWPQYLEYLGFILTGLTTVLVLGHWFHKRRRTESLKTV